MPRYNEEFEIPIEQLRRYYRLGLIVVVAGAVLWLLSSCFYMVQADSQGVVLRLGKNNRTSEPGLHAKMPWPIENVYQVPVQRVQSLEFGFATVRPGRVTQFAAASKEQKEVARMLTGDLNLAHVEWIVQYRILDPFDYLFKIGGHPDSSIAVNDLIQDVSEAVMRKLAGDASVDEVIAISRDQIAEEAKQEIQKMLDSFDAGIKVITVKLQSATPPDEVKDAFDEVNRARQNKERVINDARGERNRQIPAARGKKDRSISEAEGYRERVVQTMKGQVNAFLEQLAEYEKAPEVTRTRLYLEAMEEILSQADQKVIIDSSIEGVLPFLNLNAPEKTDASKGGKS